MVFLKQVLLIYWVRNTKTNVELILLKHEILSPITHILIHTWNALNTIYRVKIMISSHNFRDFYYLSSAILFLGSSLGPHCKNGPGPQIIGPHTYISYYFSLSFTFTPTLRCVIILLYYIVLSYLYYI